MVFSCDKLWQCSFKFTNYTKYWVVKKQSETLNLNGMDKKISKFCWNFFLNSIDKPLVRKIASAVRLKPRNRGYTQCGMLRRLDHPGYFNCSKLIHNQIFQISDFISLFKIWIIETKLIKTSWDLPDFIKNGQKSWKLIDLIKTQWSWLFIDQNLLINQLDLL